MTDDATPRRPRVATFWAERRSRWTLPLVIIVAIMVVVVIDHADAQRVTAVDNPPTPGLAPSRGGTAQVFLGDAWSGYNPSSAAGAASSTPTLLAQVLPSAFTYDPAVAPVLNSNLLTSVELTNTQPQTVVYQLDPRAVWSDGVPVSADDFVYAWESQRGGGHDVDGQPFDPATTVGYRDVASITPSDDGRTVTVVFSQPYTDWRRLFHEMLPAHIAEKVGFNHGFDNFDPLTVLSAGPMALQSATPTDAVMVPNLMWWGNKPPLDEVDIHYSPSATSWGPAVASGGQAAAQPAAFGLQLANEVSSMSAARSSTDIALSSFELSFDTTGPVTKDVGVRQALAHLVNRTELLADTFGDTMPSLGLDDNHLMSTANFAYQANPAAAAYDTSDTDQAKQLLTGAGYHQTAAGSWVDAAGHPLVIRLAVETGDPWTPVVAAGIESQLRAGGVTVQPFDVAGTAGMAAAAAFDAYDAAVVTRAASPFVSETIGWYTSELGTPGVDGSANWSHLDDPMVDQLFGQAGAVLNPIASIPIYSQVDSLLWNTMAGLPLFGEPALVVNGVRLGNVQFNATADGLLWNVQSWAKMVPKPAEKIT